MISSSVKSLNLLCIIGYLLFMSLAIDSSIVDALVFYVTEQDGRAVFTTGSVKTKALGRKEDGASKIVAIQYKSNPIGSETRQVIVSKTNLSVATVSYIMKTPELKALSTSSNSVDIDSLLDNFHLNGPGESGVIENTVSADAFFTAPPADIAEDEEDAAEDEEEAAVTHVDNSNNDFSKSTEETAKKMEPTPSSSLESINTPASIFTQKNPLNSQVAPQPSTLSFASPVVINTDAVNYVKPSSVSSNVENQLSILTLIKALPEKPWSYDPILDRYIVKYDMNTTLVLTLKPSLQKLVEGLFQNHPCKIGVAIIQDPVSGAVLAMTSFDGRKIASPVRNDFTQENLALKATFPVASLFKIVTAAAGIEKKKVTPTSGIKIGRRATLELWRAFAKSHNGVFGVVGRAVGKGILQAYAEAFGFNKPFFFDLPVTESRADIPDNQLKMGQAAAGLDKNFEISPIHVASIISTIVNRGRTMKPYLIDYVLYKGKTVFRRKPFPLSQPVSSDVATQIYEMMKTTTTHGTGKKGFGCYSSYPNLPTLCGGKTGTLTGINPHLLFTWFGGFTRTSGRDLTLVVLVGQPGRSRVKGTTLAGRICYELLVGRTPSPTKLSKK